MDPFARRLSVRTDGRTPCAPLGAFDWSPPPARTPHPHPHLNLPLLQRRQLGNVDVLVQELGLECCALSVIDGNVLWNRLDLHAQPVQQLAVADR